VAAHAMVVLFDVDNTLVDNDRVTADLKAHLDQEVGPARGEQYWRIFERLRGELGYADYLGALQHYRVEYPRDPHLLAVSRFLVNYPFADRLFPRALDVVRHAKGWGRPVILSDGDAVFQPRKIDQSGLADAVQDDVLVYIHKERELDDVERRYPAHHYVLIDDKLRILTAVKRYWQGRVTTIFPRQGHYATEAEALHEFPAADLTVDHVRDLLNYNREQVLGFAASSPIDNLRAES